MNREQAKQEIKTRISCTEYLTKSKSGLYNCPFCGSGTGANATGAVKVYEDTNTWHCHACGKGGDIIDLFQNQTGTDYNEALSLLADSIGITIDPYRPDGTADFIPARKNDRTESTESNFSGNGNTETNPDGKTAQRATEAPADYTAYFAECRERIFDPEPARYLLNRGIDLDTAYFYEIGFDPAADPAQSNHPCPRIIIPTSSAHYIGRSIDPDTPKAFQKMNCKGSSPAIFNLKALYAQGVQEVFVTEGAFDALSILAAGADAIALNSTANVNLLLKQLETRRSAATLILCLDNDQSGKKAAQELSTGLQRLNIAHISADICGGYKDPNEALTADREAFTKAIAQAQHRTAARPDNTRYFIDELMRGEIDRFKNDKKTGFANLDAQAGGLYTGLYVLAAISSLGKTSFSLQLADQLAQSGNDVIFFSLEQSRLELVSKSLARITAQRDKIRAVTSLAIRKGNNAPQVQEAIEVYKDAVNDRLSIVEGNFACNASFIGDYIRQYIRRTGNRPVCFVDYLQILQPTEENKRQSTRETVDSTVTELKRLSRELDLTIIVISSVNRANYLAPIDFESLKESGGIEFTADVIFGLQLQCLNEPLFEKQNKITEQRQRVKAAKLETPRKIELVCLKNRYGISNYSCYFDYYPANDLFTEGSADFAEPDTSEDWKDAMRV